MKIISTFRTAISILSDILTTKGDIITYSTTPTRLGIGSNYQKLIPNSAQATGLQWVAQEATQISLPSNPTGTTESASYDMMGCAVAYTPTKSGQVMVKIFGQVSNNIANKRTSVGARYGTGTAPANGDPLTGTNPGINAYNTSFTAADTYYMFILEFPASLTNGTAYWFDIALASPDAGGSIASVSQLTFIVREL